MRHKLPLVRSFLALQCCLAVATSAIASTESPGASPRLLVLDLEAHGADDSLVRLIFEEIVTAARDTRKWEVLSSAEIRDLLGIEAQRQLLGCQESSCAVDIAGAVEAREVLTGVMTKVGRNTQVRVRLLYPEDGRVGSWVTVSSRSDEELVDLVRQAVFEMAAVPYRPKSQREIAWAVNDVSAGVAALPLDAAIGGLLGARAAYQMRFGRVSVGPAVSIATSISGLPVRWEEYDRVFYTEEVSVSALAVAATGRWPSTGGRWARAYLTADVGLLFAKASSLGSGQPEWIRSADIAAAGLFVTPGLGLQLLPMSKLAVVLEVGWMLGSMNLGITDREMPLDGGAPHLVGEPRGRVSGFVLTGGVRHAF